VKLGLHIQALRTKLEAARSRDTDSFHRAQALYMQFKTTPDSGDNISLTDFMQVALQSGASISKLNEYRIQSKAMLLWHISYLERLLDQDLNTFRSY